MTGLYKRNIEHFFVIHLKIVITFYPNDKLKFLEIQAMIIDHIKRLITSKQFNFTP